MNLLSVASAAGMILILPATGCGGGSPAYRIAPDDAAALGGSGGDDPVDLRLLITLLDSDDPTVRWRAISRLRALSGETFGYDPDDPIGPRRRAVARWVEWYDARVGEQEDTGRAQGE